MDTMRSLSGEQATDLVAPLDNIRLPDGVALYVCRGLPQFFRRVEQDGRQKFDGSWLYLPEDLLSAVRQSLIVEASSEEGSWIGRSPISIDHWSVYPILLRRQVHAVIVSRSGTYAPGDREHNAQLLGTLLRWGERQFEEPDDPATDFVARLFRRNPDFEQFGKNLLDYMTDGLERGLGGIYFDAEGIFRLRVAVGDIGLSEYLPRDLSLSTARNWTEAMRRRRHFIPGDLLPGFPAFLDTVPNVVFVHPGVRSSRSEFLFVVATSGDISYQTARRLERIAELGAVLHESQFSSSAALMQLFYRLGSGNPAATDTVVRELFILLNRQLGLSRLVLALPDTPSIVVCRRPRAETIIERRDETVLDTERREEAETVGTSFCDDCAANLSNKQFARGYYLDNVRSELSCRFMLPDGRYGVVAFGLPESGGYLLTARDIFDTSAAFIGLSLRLQSHADRQTLPVGRYAVDSSPLAPRFRTISKLATGYFHDIMQLLSVVLGHAEIVEAELSKFDTETGRRAHKNVGSMNRTIDQLSRHLNQLREVCAFEYALRERLVPVRELARSIPDLLHGYLKQIEVGKGISLRFETRELDPGNSIFNFADVLDHILPVLMAILDEAICSGTIGLAVQPVDDRRRLAVVFNRAVIGHCSTADVLDRIFPDSIHHAPDRLSGRIGLSRIEVLYNDRGDDQTWIGFTPGDTDDDRSAAAVSQHRDQLEERG